MTTKIILGDCRETLKTLPDDSVQMCFTSPPYWCLRSYLPAHHVDKHLEIGSESTLLEWVATMVDVFREVRRVLRPDGILLLNLGDAYTGSGRGGNSTKITGRGKDASRPMTVSARRDRVEIPRSDVSVLDLGEKEMMGQPWRVAFALQDDGWFLRQEIIWNKPNPMPESARDRCTKAHEHIFLLTKKSRYFWNFDAMQEEANGNAHPRRATIKAPDGWKTGPGAHGSIHDEGREKGKTTPKAALASDTTGTGAYADGMSERMGRGPGWRAREASAVTPKARAGTEHGYMEGKAERMAEVGVGNITETRNPRSVWTIPIHGFKGAHFATFPPALAERAITAGSRPGDTVLDPFGGAGTVGLVAERMQRNAILCELDERSVGMSIERIEGDNPMFTEVECE